jgi:hypothetical protein
VGLEQIIAKYVHIFQYILERTDAITNEVLEIITFGLAHLYLYIQGVSGGTVITVGANIRHGVIKFIWACTYF